MRKAFLFFSIIVTTTFQAQQFKLTKGADFEKANWDSRMLDHDDKGFYYLTQMGSFLSPKYVLRKFDLITAKLIYERTIDFTGDDYMGGRAFLVDIFNKNGKILAFSKSTKGKQNHLMMQEYSSETGELIGKPVIVDEMADTHAYVISEAVVDFKISFSPDNKKMLIIGEVKEAHKVQKVFAKLYDLKGYKKLWEKEPIAVYRNSTVSSFNYCVDNLGNFSYVFVYLKPKSEGFNRYANEHFAHAIGVSLFGRNDSKTIEITSNEIATFDPKLEIINNLLVCTGEYEHQGLPGSAYVEDKKVGFFLLTIDGETGVLKSKSYEYFTPEIHKKLSYKDKGYVNTPACQKAYTNYKTLSINDAFYQIKLRTIDDDYYWARKGMEILIYKYDLNNKLEWMKVLPRSTFKEFTAVNYFVGKNLNLLYYEDIKNLNDFPNPETYNPGKYKQVKSGEKAVLMFVKIDERGNVIREKIEKEGENLILDRLNYDKVVIKEKNSIVIPVKQSKSERRYDILKVVD